MVERLNLNTDFVDGAACDRQEGLVNGPLKNEKSRQILAKSRNLAQPTNGSQILCLSVTYIWPIFPKGNRPMSRPQKSTPGPNRDSKAPS